MGDSEDIAMFEICHANEEKNLSPEGNKVFLSLIHI